jgi:ABC-type branched-subunit amino acid transport system ATPase component
VTANSRVAPVPPNSVAASRLECSQVTVRFGGLVALREVNLAVPAAATVGLVGPNGAGKSTLFGVLSGLTRPSSGQVFLDGADVTGARPQPRAARGMARTFQHPELFGDLTVRQHIILASRVRNARRRVWSDLFTLGSLHPPGAGETEQVDGLIELLGLQKLADQRALGLPLGSARLVELGRALATSPAVLLLDEPSSGLDSAETEQFESVINRVAAEQGISVLLVEHDVELVMRMCSTVYVLDFGEVIASGSPGQVRNDPKVRSAYLGEEISRVGSAEPAAEPAINTRVVTQSAAATGPADNAGAGVKPGSLAVRNLSVRYGDAVALSDLTFDLGPGRTMAVLGPNGAGKSSLARALSGLVRPQAGSVVLDGSEVSAAPAEQIRRMGLVYLPEGRGIFPSLTVVENLRMAAAIVDGRPARRQAVNRALELFPRLADRRRLLAGSLSGGEQQMLSLARVLATAPSIIIADELSLGLAPLMVDLVFEGLQAAREAGTSILLIEQYVHRALGFADDCLILQRGTVAWAGPADQAETEALAHYLGQDQSANETAIEGESHDPI